MYYDGRRLYSNNIVGPGTSIGDGRPFLMKLMGTGDGEDFWKKAWSLHQMPAYVTGWTYQWFLFVLMNLSLIAVLLVAGPGRGGADESKGRGRGVA